MTPAQHKTAAETALTAAEAAPTSQYATGPTDADWLVIDAHARLSKAAGTGTHYTTAETALATAESAAGLRDYLTRLLAAQSALAHAHLAD